VLGAIGVPTPLAMIGGALAIGGLLLMGFRRLFAFVSE
jgi:hypothetical protein